MPPAPLDIECRYCHALVGQPCHNKITNQALENFRAHQCRITDTNTIIPLPQFIPAPPNDEEELF